MIVYITSPVGQVAGEFSVKDIITDDVDALWDRTETMAGIDRKVFMDYFAGRDVGHAIVIGNVNATSSRSTCRRPSACAHHNHSSISAVEAAVILRRCRR